MTLLFRSKSCRLGGESTSSPPSSSVWDDSDGNETEEEKTEEFEDNEEEFEDYDPISTPFINTPVKLSDKNRKENNGQFPILAFVATALRKSLLVTCSVEREDVSSLDISYPTNVQHISHVTFDRFKGFLGLPQEFQPEILKRVPSASASVFGVSPQSMQCSIDGRGNSVPTILIRMQKRLYAEGGLQAEGIFRINAENSQEENVRGQLNKGIVPQGIDVHCLAGLIKAWFRELPKGVLDCLKPEQVMHCNTEDECTQLLKLLPPMEAALLDWAINLMADVVQNEQYNKMNARNIAMVFAPNMTQMADPLTALIHAVQVMNFLKTLIVKTLQSRDESADKTKVLSSCSDFSDNASRPSHKSTSFGELIYEKMHEKTTNVNDQVHSKKLLRSVTLDRLDCTPEKKHRKSHKKNEEGKTYSSPIVSVVSESLDEDREVEVGILDRINFRKGMKKLCRHPVFQLSKQRKQLRLGL
ncbi:rho GTPase-activating protein 3-like [Amaranthus tricolor]|uniref:rho GTPase-activating protein 3-like n=1 Tax=Amaranthus tricolor TaxID=29722 RepID=UPI0025890E14|nr:rho GTPase-activating protein 3-like [Amaranthus tricolor]